MTETDSEPEFDGDVTLSDEPKEHAPFKVSSPQDVHVKPNAIDGDLHLINPEWVITNTPISGGATNNESNTHVKGDIEDIYIDENGVTGDVIIENAGDVFISHSAVTGDISVTGEEDTFKDNSETEVPDRSRYDKNISGWNNSTQVTKPDVGIEVVGGKNDIEVQRVNNEVHVYVVGWNNSVEVSGRKGTAHIHFIANNSHVEVGKHIDAHIATNTGKNNTINEQSIPADDLVETTKKEAFRSAFIGKEKVTYQKPADDEEYCPSCGEQTDSIVERHSKEAFFIFAYPIKTYEKASSHECENCSPRANPDVELSEEERKDIF